MEETSYALMIGSVYTAELAPTSTRGSSSVFINLGILRSYVSSLRWTHARRGNHPFAHHRRHRPRDAGVAAAAGHAGENLGCQTCSGTDFRLAGP